MRFINMLAAAVFLIPSSAPPIQQSRPDKSNVVLIMTDDMGYADLGSYVARDIRTPHIDSLARDGIKFTEFYANAMSCSPTRAGLISGQYQQRYGIERPLPPAGRGSERGLPVLDHSLPRLLKRNGYATSGRVAPPADSPYSGCGAVE
jgi:arylsulfatase A